MHDVGRVARSGAGATGGRGGLGAASNYRLQAERPARGRLRHEAAGIELRVSGVTKCVECKTCGVEKPATTEHFYSNPGMANGLRNTCKKCTLRAVCAYQAQPHIKIAKKKYRIANRNKQREYARKYRKKNPGYETQQSRQWRNANPQASKAHYLVQRARKLGRLKQGPCEICGLEKTQAHHDDYSKPLDVRWLCAAHHAEHHRQRVA